MALRLQPQEIPFDHPESCNYFGAHNGTPACDSPRLFTATPGALEKFGQYAIAECLIGLQALAIQRNGLDYLQVFVDPEAGARLWFVDDGAEAVTALLPEEY